MWARRTAIFLAAAVVIVLATALYRHFYPLPPKLTLRAVRFGELDGWSEDHVAATVPVFLKSCAAVTARGDGEHFDPVPKSGDFGVISDWRPLCDEAAALPYSDAAAAAFFEKNFTPLLAGNNGNSDGLFTGYFEVVLNGSRRREGPYQTPIYRPPPDPKAYSRANRRWRVGRQGARIAVGRRCGRRLFPSGARLGHCASHGWQNGASRL